MLLVDEVQRELVLVGADFVTDAALPGTGQAVQRGVQEVHSTLEEQNAAVLTAEQPPLTDVVREDVVKGREPGDGLGVLNGLVLGRPDQGVGDGWQLGGRSLGRRDHTGQRDGGGWTEQRRTRGARLTVAGLRRHWRHKVSERRQLLLSLGEDFVYAGQSCCRCGDD